MQNKPPQMDTLEEEFLYFTKWMTEKNIKPFEIVNNYRGDFKDKLRDRGVTPTQFNDTVFKYGKDIEFLRRMHNTVNKDLFVAPSVYFSNFVGGAIHKNRFCDAWFSIKVEPKIGNAIIKQIEKYYAKKRAQRKISRIS
jgi:hypothetical protein